MPTPFDLERALAGAPLVTRGGVPAVKFRHNPDPNQFYIFCAEVNGSDCAFTPKGTYLLTSPDGYDLFMADAALCPYCSAGDHDETAKACPRRAADAERFAKGVAAAAVPSGPSGPLSEQVGGSHYKDCAIQPVQFIHANRLNFLEGCILKRLCRHRRKNGRQDLLKARHEIDLLLALEYPQGETAPLSYTEQVKKGIEEAEARDYHHPSDTAQHQRLWDEYRASGSRLSWSDWLKAETEKVPAP